jgi:hypothetical protein
MRRLWLVGVAVGSVLVAVTPALAEQARIVDRDVPSGGQATAGAPARVIMPPDPLGDVELASALGRSRPDVEACLQRNGLAHGARISVRIDRRSRLTIRVALSPRDAAIEACVDVAVRRHVQPLQSRPIVRPVLARLRAGVFPTPLPLPPPPPPPTWPAGRYDESQVHGALDAMRASLLECVPDAGAGVIGRVRLRVVVHPDGSMTLMGVELPPGLHRSAAPLSCLAGRVAWLRIAAPPADRRVVHDLDLGASLGR